MAVVLWSTRLYIIFWIILGASSLAFGIIKDLDPSNTWVFCNECTYAWFSQLLIQCISTYSSDFSLYTTGQTWLGIAVTIGYAYFGLSGKNTPKAETETSKPENEQQPNADDAEQSQNVNDGGGDSTNDTGATTLEANFTDEAGKAKDCKTRYELMQDIDTYTDLKEDARRNRNFKDAAAYQKCLEQLYKLKPTFPTVQDLEKQLEEVEAEMDAAADQDNFEAAEKLRVIVAELQEKISEERSGEEMRVGGDSNV